MHRTVAVTRYHPSAEQLALASTIEESLLPQLPLARLHGSRAESEDTWSSLADIGIFAMTASEAQGGSGLGAVEEALIAMTLGRRLAAPAVLATMGAAHAQIVHANDGRAPDLRRGRVAAGFLSGGRTLVVENAGAGFVLMRETAGAAVHAIGSRAGRAVDVRLWVAELREYPSLDEPLARFDSSGVLRLRLIDAAVLAGMSQAALDMAVA